MQIMKSKLQYEKRTNNNSDTIFGGGEGFQIHLLHSTFNLSPLAICQTLLIDKIIDSACTIL